MRPIETIGDRIKAKRLAAGLKQNQLAEAAGLKPGTLADIESGRSQSTTKLHRIADELGVRVAWLETGKGPESPADEGRQSPADQRHQVIDPIQKNVSDGSRIRRLDPEMIREGYEAVANFFEAAGSVFKVDVDADLMARAYEWAQSSDPSLLHAIEADVLARIAERQGVQGGEQDEAAGRGVVRRGRK